MYWYYMLGSFHNIVFCEIIVSVIAESIFVTICIYVDRYKRYAMHFFVIFYIQLNRLSATVTVNFPPIFLKLG